MTITTEGLKDLVAERIDLKAQEAEIKERLAMIDGLIIDELGTGITPVGDVKVQVSTRKTLNNKALAAQYTPEAYPSLYKPVLDTAVVKEQFAPSALEPFYTVSAPFVTVK